jgi:hypothetical protein
VTQTPLKSVFTLDSESQTYKPAAHNLSANEALERFNNEPNAQIVLQSERHRASDLSKCKACKKAAEDLTAKHAQTAGSEAEEETVSAQESESD